MKGLVWNVRGFNYPLKQREVMAKISKLSVNFICFLETRVKQHKMQDIIKCRFPGWNCFNNCTDAYNGRIWFL